MTTVGALCLMASRMTEEKFAERLIAERLTDVEQIRLWRRELAQRRNEDIQRDYVRDLLLRDAERYRPNPFTP